jgi:hypothetical protein
MIRGWTEHLRLAAAAQLLARKSAAPASASPRLAFSVQGSGFRVQGSGFRVQGLGFRVTGGGGTRKGGSLPLQEAINRRGEESGRR